MSVRRLALWSTAVVTACVAAAGLVSSLPASAASTTQDVFARSWGTTELSPHAGIYVGVATASVTGGTGSWVVQATATVVNWGPSDYYRCRLSDGDGTILNTASALVGNSTTPGNAGAGALVVPITVAAVVNSKSNGNWAALLCGHEGGNRPSRVDPGATVWAHRSPELQLQ
ncbi:hypothetical protein [Amycolatopsis sp.]|uniref:hypothetical protein n=1 Tax=Amycolatopsis sp. TaxID=37632 RepID=UPI002D7E9EC2|nr:hypothetical protein [Amycolatopsis sp.]HET6703555.1 hypothetical protein [Amycolatopsis sp.]